ncbi:hypothetical protein [Mesobacillus subterraneus]|uniref:Uncharacterized protein n=1 Tax=Mesobacillus subterraneus TaxID=285983 RepID=A0A427TDA2_9BACI|nr:hypothetical protein [Mesobacillus subterraneus]RSD20762.1 hypothetical protein EJA10_22860 [Mesobacillus subterraneus]
MSSKDKGVLYYDDSSHKKNKKDSCKSQCCCKNVNENPCDCMPQWQKGDQYLSGFHVNGNIYQFDNLEIPIPTTEGEFARISNIPLNCNNKVVWLNITAGVINRSAANERLGDNLTKKHPIK